jgi:TOMM system kinase/cyclase fusion protein
MELASIGPYRLERRLGAGGMGEVYEAYDERLDRRVALKLIWPGRAQEAGARERLRREARASARLNHPNIVQVYDILQTEEADCIVMELVGGATLAQRLRGGPLDVEEALAVAGEIAEALEAAHAAGVVHRDLKTENVILTPAGRAKVLDFGIAKQLAPGAEGSLTAAGTVLGTCRAMSPEQARGGEVDFRSDLFSFGSLLYEVVTGKSPFLEAHAAATLLRICHYRHTPARDENPRVPESLSALIDRLLEKDPERRPQSASEVAREIDRIRTRRPGRASSGVAARGSGGVPRRSEPASAQEATLLSIPPSNLPRSDHGERRQVTVMGCRLVRAGGGPPDPEDLLAGQAWLTAAAEEVARRFEGSLGPAAGDAVQVLFGYPQGHEDNTRRAVLAALAMTAQSAQDGLAGTGLALQVGIHTGPLVVARAEGSGRIDLSLGETAHLTNALWSGAAPGAVLLSEAAHHLVAASFDCEPLLVPLYAGSERPVAAWRVLADRGSRGRIESGETAALTPMVARGRELDLLLDRWALAQEGRGQVVLLAGEAGIGKSRLVHELRQRVASGEPAWLEGRCSPFHRNSAFYPFLDALRRRLGPDTAPAESLNALEALLRQLGLPLPEAVPLLAALLSLPLGERYAPLHLRPERQRARTLETLAALLLAEAERRPALLVIEDLHWGDPSSRELLGLLIEQVAASRMLVVLTFRPELHSPWSSLSYVTQLTLGPLTARQSAEMVGRVVQGRALPAEVAGQVVAKADGVPLVVEELTKAVLESGLLRESAEGYELAGAFQPLEIPATLRDSLTARLDRLGSGKEVAQLGSVLGREFSLDLLAAVSPWDEAFLQTELDRLVDAELLYRRGLPPKMHYLFKHALIQDAAYDSLLRGARQQWHRRIAETLERRFSEIAQDQPELIAHHYTEAGEPAPAAAFWQLAGEKAIRNSAGPEATSHLTKALELLATLPESSERDQREILLQVSLGVSEGLTRSYGTSRAEQAYSRAWELCRRSSRTPQLFPVLRGLMVSSLIAGQASRALEIAASLMDHADEQEDPVMRLASRESRGFALLEVGRFTEARTQIEEALSLFDPTLSYVDERLPGNGDPIVGCLSVLSSVLWYLGYPQAAVEREREALARAQQLPYAMPNFFAWVFSSEVRAQRHETGLLRQCSERLLQLASEHDLAMAQPPGLFYQGWVLAAQGLDAEGGARMREALARRRTLGFRVSLVHPLTMMAEWCLRTGRIDEGLEAVEEGLALSRDSGQAFLDADLYRLKGELLALRGEPGEAVEDLLLRALEHARGQQAKSLELRAAMSLARFMAARNRRAEGRDLLAGVYCWFTEGFDTGDLQEARSLLAELA